MNPNNGLKKANEQLTKELAECRLSEAGLRREKQALEAYIETTPAVVLVLNADQTVALINGKGCEILGYSRDEILGKNWFDNFLAEEDRMKVKSVFHRIMAGEVEPVEYFENYVLTKSGDKRLIAWHNAMLRDEDGSTSVALTTGVDITERKRAEEALIQSRNQFAAVARIGAMAGSTLDLGRVLSNILTGTIKATGASVGMIFLRDQETGFLTWGASHGLSEAFVAAYRDQVIKPGEGLTGRILQSGEAIYIAEDSSHDPRIARPVVMAEGLNSFIGVPVYAEDRIIGVMNILTRPPDVLGEDEIALVKAVGIHVGLAIQNAQLYKERRASLREKEVLLREIHHRVKNNLQVISSMLQLQSEYIKDDQSVSTLMESRNRVNVMAFIHEKLYESKSLSVIDFDGYIKELVSSLFISYGAQLERVTYEVRAEGITFGISKAIPCGLIINELVSNSLKHSFPAGRSGKVLISIRPEAEDRLVLIVSDNGIGMPAGYDPAKTETLGLKLVNALTGQLDGTIELIRNEGTTFKIVFPA